MKFTDSVAEACQGDLPFIECEKCRAKPGTPVLCDECLHRRAIWFNERSGWPEQKGTDFEKYVESVSYMEGVDAMLDGYIPSKDFDGKPIYLKERVRMLLELFEVMAEARRITILKGKV